MKLIKCFLFCFFSPLLKHQVFSEVKGSDPKCPFANRTNDEGRWSESEQKATNTNYAGLFHKSDNTSRRFLLLKFYLILLTIRFNKVMNDKINE